MPRPRPNNRPIASMPGAGHRLDVEVTSDGADWSCLGDIDPSGLVTGIAGEIASQIALPSEHNLASLVLANDARLRELNRQWRSQDKATNVLSFPSGETPKSGTGEHFIGDVIIAEETLVREASEQGISAVAHFQHLALHGLLHLLGYDHENSAEADEMEALETRILAKLGIADPYAESTPVDTFDATTTRTGALRA